MEMTFSEVERRLADEVVRPWARESELDLDGGAVFDLCSRLAVWLSGGGALLVTSDPGLAPDELTNKSGRLSDWAP